MGIRIWFGPPRASTLPQAPSGTEPRRWAPATSKIRPNKVRLRAKVGQSSADTV
jgi:hypothetical protein